MSEILEPSEHSLNGFAGPERAYIIGPVRFGDNVYIGSMSCISPGITIAHNVAVGAHSSVAASLLEPGVYVSQKLRYIAKAPEERLEGLKRMPDLNNQRVFWREGGRGARQA